MATLEFVKVKFKEYGLVITAERGFSSMGLVEVWSESEYYRKGLQYNHKNLVNMDKVLEGICGILESLVLSSNLTEESYNKVMEACKPFINRHKSYDQLRTFIEGDEW